MKKHPIFSLCSLLVLMLLAGCTLMLEEYAVPEEEKGFDEPVTVENDFGTFTYQYNEGVLPVTQTIQEYITRVEDDSIIYFSSDIPQKWLPVRGSLLAAGCTRTLPNGLNHRVISVDKVGGEYRVVATMASRQDVYKELEINFDYDYQAPDLPVYDSLYLDSAGIDIEKLGTTDFGLVDDAYGNPEKAPRYVRTRSDSYKDTVTIDHLFKFEFPRADVTLKHTLKQTIHYEENLTLNKKTQYNIDHSETELMVVLSIPGTIAGESILNSTSTNDPREYPKWIQELEKIRTGKPVKKTPRIAKLRCPLPTPVPLVAIFEFSGNISLDGAIFGGFNAKITHAKVKEGYEYWGYQDKKYPIHEKIEDAKFNLEKLNFGGQLKASFGFRVGAGLEIPGLGLGSTIGLGFTAGADLRYEPNFLNFDQGDVIVDDEKNYIKLYVDFKGDVRIYISPLGFTVLDANTVLYDKRIAEQSFYFTPRIDTKKTKGSFAVVKVPDETLGERSVIRYNNTINFEKLYTFDTYWNKKNTHPRLRVYIGNGYEGKYVDFKTKGGASSSGEQIATAGTDYAFTFTQDDIPNSEMVLTCVPCLYDDLEKTTTEFRQHSKSYGLQKPKITYYKYGQTRGALVDDLYAEAKAQGNEEYESFKEEFEYTYGPAWQTTGKYFYSFWFRFKFENAPFMNEWGYDVEILRDNNKEHKLLSKRVTVGTNLAGSMYSGTKKLLCEFVTNFKSTNAGGDCMLVRLRPYSINLLGEETTHAWTAWKDVYMNIKKEDKDDVETFSSNF